MKCAWLAIGWILCLTIGCSTAGGDGIVEDAGAVMDTGVHSASDARADSHADARSDATDASHRDASVDAHADSGRDATVVPGMDSTVAPGMDATVIPGMDVAVVSVDVTPWSPPDVPPLDVMGATLDVSTTPADATFVLAGATAASASLFGGTVTSSRAPSIVYPSPGVIVPPNLPSFEVHFMPGAGNTQFAISFAGPDGTVTFYTGCSSVGGGCVTSLTTAQFAEIARVAQPGGDVTLVVKGTDSAGSSYGASAPQTLGVTATVMHGGLYYWTASSGDILRYDWDLPGASPETYLDGNPIACVGCHVLARDGRRAAVGHFIPAPSQMNTLDVASRAALSSTFGGNFASFSPDDARLIVSDGAHLWVADAQTGAVAPGLPGGTVGSMPDWARDGYHVVYAQPMTVPPIFGSPGHDAPANLMMLTWSGAGFGAPTPLVTATTENNYYPAFSPDGQWVLFNRSAMDSYDATDATLWAVPTTGAHTPVRLTAANTSAVVGNSWPKFAPFVQLYQGQPLFWMTFASRRDYGLRLQQQTAMATDQTEQLWMAAFRPGMASTGDPSVPAFWLPMQDITTGNHIGQWSEAVLRAGCTTNADCMTNEHCQMTNSGLACVGFTS